MDEQTERFKLEDHEREMLMDLQNETKNLQQQTQGALRMMLKSRKLSGMNWMVDENFQYLSAVKKPPQEQPDQAPPAFNPQPLPEKENLASKNGR